MNIVNDVTDANGLPLIVPTRPDQHVDYSCVDTEIYVPLFMPDRNRDRDQYRHSAAQAYRNSCLRFDLFNTLAKFDPQTTPYGFALNRELHRRFRDSEEYDQIRDRCNYEPHACYLAADELTRRLHDSLDGTTQDASRQADDAQDALNQAKDALRQLQDDPDADLADIRRQQGVVQLAQAELDAALEHLELMLDRGIQADAIAKAILTALTSIAETSDMAQALASMAGTHAAERQHVPVDPHTLRTADTLRRSADFKKIVQLIGRVRNDLFHALVSKSTAHSGTAVEVETGNDLNRLLPESLAGLVDPDLAALTEYNFMREALDQLAVQNTDTAHDGDAIILVDSSGSMAGTPIVSAKAFAIALAITLSRARRSCHVAFFNYGVLTAHARTFRPSDFDGRESTVNAISHLATTGAGGGTDINAALKYAGTVAASLQFNKPDVVVISDGEDSMSNTARTKFEQFRKESGARLLSIFVGMSRAQADRCPLGTLSDKTWCEDDILKNLVEVGEAIA